MYYTWINTVVGKILIAGDDAGLRTISFEKGKYSAEIGIDWKKDEVFLKNAVDQLKSYFAGELKKFDLPLCPEGTPFQKSVWKALLDIPYGKTASYKDIAVAVKNPKAVRAVGGANGRNPIPIVIPCHRVISSDGKMGGYSSGLDIKERLLKLEREHCL